jgi:hypothetical protein
VLLENDLTLLNTSNSLDLNEFSSSTFPEVFFMVGLALAFFFVLVDVEVVVLVVVVVVVVVVVGGE